MICFVCGGLLYYTFHRLSHHNRLSVNYINKLVFEVNDMNGVPCRNISLKYCMCKYIFYQHKIIEMQQLLATCVPQRY